MQQLKKKFKSQTKEEEDLSRVGELWNQYQKQKEKSSPDAIRIKVKERKQKRMLKHKSILEEIPREINLNNSLDKISARTLKE